MRNTESSLGIIMLLATMLVAQQPAAVPQQSAGPNFSQSVLVDTDFSVDCAGLNLALADVEKFQRASDQLADKLQFTAPKRPGLTPLAAWNRLGDDFAQISLKSPPVCHGWSRLRGIFLNEGYLLISGALEKSRKENFPAPEIWQALSLSAAMMRDMSEEYKKLGGDAAAIPIISGLDPSLFAPQEYVRRRAAQLKNGSVNQLGYHLKALRSQFRSLCRNLFPGIPEEKYHEFLEKNGVKNAEILLMPP